MFERRFRIPLNYLVKNKIKIDSKFPSNYFVECEIEDSGFLSDELCGFL